MPTEACLEEFEALSAIFLDEINIGEEQPDGCTKVCMVLFPATGDDQESKYVTLTLELTLLPDYPKVSPLIRFRNPRGLSESLLDTMYRRMTQCCAERLESQMVFELIDMGKEFLTINNRPASECPICLLSFTSCDMFFRSQCFHHFHSYCLGRYLENVMKVAASGDHLPGDVPGKTCPVCRDALDDDIDIQKLLGSPPPFEESLEIADGEAILKEWHGQQEKLKMLFDKQKSQGGIIDLSESDKRRLVISSPRGAVDSDSPSSSSDGSSLNEGELSVAPRNAAGGTTLAQNNAAIRNSRTEFRTKAMPKEKTMKVTAPQSGNAKNSAPATKSNSQSKEETVVANKTSPTMGRAAPNGGHGRGKGGNSGHHNRRRNK